MDDPTLGIVVYPNYFIRSAGNGSKHCQLVWGEGMGGRSCQIAPGPRASGFACCFSVFLLTSVSKSICAYFVYICECLWGLGLRGGMKQQEKSPSEYSMIYCCRKFKRLPYLAL